MDTNRLPPQAVAYTRISTRHQTRGLGLQAQERVIRRFADRHNIAIDYIFDDVASGMNKRAHEVNEGLTNAVATAKRLGVPLIVSSLDRVARCREPIEAIMSGIDILDASEGRALPLQTVRRKSKHAGEVVDAIRLGTRRVLSRHRAGGGLGHPARLKAAQRRGAVSNIVNADRVSLEIGAIIKKVFPDGTPTRQQICSALNSHGLRTRQGKSWTPASLKRPLARLRAIQDTQMSDDC